MIELPKPEMMKTVELYPVKLGDIVLYDSHASGLYSDLQKDIQDVRGTKYELTHSDLVFLKIRFPLLGKEVQTNLQAKAAVTVTEWQDVIDNDYMEFYVFRFRSVPERVIESIMYDLYHKYDGESYGFLQILYFAREAFFKRNILGQLLYPIAKQFHGGREIELWNNWFPDGIICSEFVYLFMVAVAITMHWEDLIVELHRWNQDNISPVSLLKIIDKFPQYYELIHHKFNRLTD